MIRAILVLTLFVLFFIGFLPVLAVLFIIRSFAPELARKISFHIIQAFLALELFVSGTKIIVEGYENIPDDEAVLFVGNHRSYFDVLTAYSKMKNPTGFIAKKELNSIPIMNWWMIMIECLFLDRSNVREGMKTIKTAIDKINNGISMAIFPEGTRNRNEDKDVPMEFKDGSLKIAQKTGCKIVPFALKDTEKIFEEHVPFVKAQTVRIHFCEPVYYKDIPEEYKKTPGAYIRRLILDVNKGTEFREE